MSENADLVCIESGFRGTCFRSDSNLLLLAERVHTGLRFPTLYVVCTCFSFEGLDRECVSLRILFGSPPWGFQALSAC